MSTIEVTCVGLATADTIVDLPAWPARDGRMLADGIVRSYGGPAATAAVTLARLGHRVAMVGAVGDDPAGRSVRDDLGASGVDVRHVTIADGATPESVILLDRSEATRTILHAPGARLAAIGGDALAVARASRWVHVDHAGFAMAEAIDRGSLSVDAGHRIEELVLDGVALFAPSRSALLDRYPGQHLGTAIAAALDEGAERVVVTLGAEGAVAVDADGAWRVPGVKVQSISTLGAGDVFHGALLASLLEGASLADAARRANVAAALSTRALDGRGAIPNSDELDAAARSSPAVEPVVLEGVR